MRSYSHLSDDERDQIGILRAAGRSMAAIARALGRAKTTISRELRRNALPSGGYSPLHAAARGIARDVVPISARCEGCKQPFPLIPCGFEELRTRKTALIKERLSCCKNQVLIAPMIGVGPLGRTIPLRGN